MASATTPHDGPTHTEQPRHIARPHRLALGGSDLLTRRVVRCVCITNRPRPEQHKMECARWVTLKNRASTAASCKSCSAASQSIPRLAQDLAVVVLVRRQVVKNTARWPNSRPIATLSCSTSRTGWLNNDADSNSTPQHSRLREQVVTATGPLCAKHQPHRRLSEKTRPCGSRSSGPTDQPAGVEVCLVIVPAATDNEPFGRQRAGLRNDPFHGFTGGCVGVTLGPVFASSEPG